MFTATGAGSGSGTAILSGGGYGLQVFNSAAQVAFDSRALGDSSIVPTNYLPENSGFSSPTTEDPITTVVSRYCSAESAYSNSLDTFYDILSMSGFIFSNGYSPYGTGIWFYSYWTFFENESPMPNFSPILIGEKIT